MRKDHKNQDLSREPEKSSRQAAEDLNRDLQQDKRFPESQMTKESRKDAESVQQDNASLEELAEDVDVTMGSRVTSKDPADIAGVADIDKGLGRARKD
jgi:hypothetical protein